MAEIDHAINCRAWFNGLRHEVNGEDCTCGLRWRIELTIASTRAVELEAENRELRDLAASMYQFAGCHNARVDWLDALSAAARGESFTTENLLPVLPNLSTTDHSSDCGCHLCALTAANARIAELEAQVEGYEHFAVHCGLDTFPHQCGLCNGVVESKDDCDWHGLGNCVEICSACSGSGCTPPPPSSTPELEVKP